MQENYELNHNIPTGLKQIFQGTEDSRVIFFYMLKESKNFVSDIMKESFSTKTYQFCLFKVLQGISLVAEINGLLGKENPMNTLSGFSVEELKKQLIQYKGLQSKFGNLDKAP